MKKWVKILIFILIILVFLLIGYSLYFYNEYDRLPDRERLETKTSGAYSYFADDEAINAGRAYNIMTYNIGYGFTTSDYSSFEYGGKYTWAPSEELVMGNLCDIADVINKTAPDFILLQNVDIDSTRSYHVNELDLVNEFLKGYYYSHATTSDTPFVMYPLYAPKGECLTSMATYSTGIIVENLRRSLPIQDDLTKYLEPDSAYMVTRIPLANEKSLLIYNVHLTSKDDEVKRSQLKMIFNDMELEYRLGNYIVCGGDFGYNLRMEPPVKDDNTIDIPYFPRDMIPQGFSLGIDSAFPVSVIHDSTRDAKYAYEEDVTPTVTEDGFIVSDNIMINYYNNADWKYEYSNHDPVLMQIYVKE